VLFRSDSRAQSHASGYVGDVPWLVRWRGKQHKQSQETKCRPTLCALRERADLGGDKVYAALRDESGPGGRSDEAGRRGLGQGGLGRDRGRLHPAQGSALPARGPPDVVARSNLLSPNSLRPTRRGFFMPRASYLGIPQRLCRVSCRPPSTERYGWMQGLDLAPSCPAALFIGPSELHGLVYTAPRFEMAGLFLAA